MKVTTSFVLAVIPASAFVPTRKYIRNCIEYNLSKGENIVDQSTLTLLEHVNLNVPSHEYILPFYLDLLGCGLDPRKASNLKPDAPKKTIWANCGASQFHLPYGDTPQTIPGHIGLSYESLDGLKNRLQESSNNNAVKSYEIGVDERTEKSFVKLVDQYDNVFYCREGKGRDAIMRQPIIGPDETDEWGDDATRYGRKESECLGINYVEFLCPTNSANKIALFYESVFDATTSCIDLGDSKIAIIAFGSVDEMGRAEQSLLFRETNEVIPPYDGHHIAFYVGSSAADFDFCYKNAELANLVWVNPRFSDKADSLQGARNWKQFRMKDIVDMETGDVIMELEHEVRSVEHESWLGSPSKRS